MEGSRLNTPVLLLGFNRPKEITQVLESIAAVRPVRLYVACDGPRNASDALLVDQVHQAVEQMITWDCECFKLYREDNLGCGRAVSEGITWFFQQEEEGIILEDDCLPDISFFRFCEAMLERYRKNPEIHHIGGCNPLNQGGESGEYYCSIFNRIWGWATWRESWAHFDLSVKTWPQLKAEGFLGKYFPPKLAAYYVRIFDAVYADEIDTWDYQWLLCRLQLGWAIIPEVNLVKNIGFGPHATKTQSSFDPYSLMGTGKYLDSDFELSEIKPHQEYDTRWGKRLLHTASNWGKLQSLIKSWWGRVFT